MPSIHQIETARVNGAKSKGPATPEGRQKSSQNSLKHGLTAKTIVLNNESQEKFLDLLDCYFQRFQPADQVEYDLVKDIVAGRWRQERIWAMETAIMDVQMDRQDADLRKQFAKFDEPVRTAEAWRVLTDESGTLSQLHRHETRLQRSITRATNQLLKLQEHRGVQNEPKPDPPGATPPSAAPPSAQNRDRKRAAATEQLKTDNCELTTDSQNEPEPPENPVSKKPRGDASGPHPTSDIQDPTSNPGVRSD